MKTLRLKNLQKLYFNLNDFSRALNISLPSAKVMASRYVKAGLLIRLKRDLYILSERWPYTTLEEKFQFAGLIQTPSYVSLMTALSYYEISTQIQQNFIESIAQKRTKQVVIKETVFNYSKIKPQLYFGFIKKETFFIAEPEKALLDALYLMSLNRYTLDISSIDFSKLDRDKIESFLKQFPPIVQKMVN